MKFRRCNMIDKKRGVSPLIATVLLIAFAVGLSAIVMNWGKQYVQDTAEMTQTKSNQEVACNLDVSIRWVEIGGVDRVCFDDSAIPTKLVYIFENGPYLDLSGYVLRVLYANSTFMHQDNVATILKAYPMSSSFTFPPSITATSNITMVEIVPRVSVDGSDLTCANRAIRVENLRHCN